MKKSTRTALAAILAADETIPAELAGRALKLLDGKPETPPPLSRVIRTKEACSILGVGVKTLRAWSARGRLVPVEGGREGWRVGYTEESVRAFAEGRTAKKGG